MLSLFFAAAVTATTADAIVAVCTAVSTTVTAVVAISSTLK